MATKAWNASLNWVSRMMNEMKSFQGDLVRQARGIQTALGASFEVVRGRLAACGCGRADFDWAACLMNSRCFATAVGGRAVHLAVPGIDMCNHERDAPSALIRSAATLMRLKSFCFYHSAALLVCDLHFW